MSEYRNAAPGPGFASSFRQLSVYQEALEGAMALYERTKRFPPEERHSMVDQARRSSRSGCANLAEGWRKRRYRQAFIAKLSDAEAEAAAAETQVWIELAHRCGHLSEQEAASLDGRYEAILAQLVGMIASPDRWLLPSSGSAPRSIQGRRPE